MAESLSVSHKRHYLPAREPGYLGATPLSENRKHYHPIQAHFSLCFLGLTGLNGVFFRDFFRGAHYRLRLA